MAHATKPARLLVAGRPQSARMPALIILGYAVAANSNSSSRSIAAATGTVARGP